MVYFRNPFRRQHFRERSGGSGFAVAKEDCPDTLTPVRPVPGPDIPVSSTPPTGPSPTRY